MSGPFNSFRAEIVSWFKDLFVLLLLTTYTSCFLLYQLASRIVWGYVAIDEPVTGDDSKVDQVQAAIAVGVALQYIGTCTYQSEGEGSQRRGILERR